MALTPAEKQAHYRERLKERQSLAGPFQPPANLASLAQAKLEMLNAEQAANADYSPVTMQEFLRFKAGLYNDGQGKLDAKYSSTEHTFNELARFIDKEVYQDRSGAIQAEVEAKKASPKPAKAASVKPNPVSHTTTNADALKETLRQLAQSITDDAKKESDRRKEEADKEAAAAAAKAASIEKAAQEKAAKAEEDYRIKMEVAAKKKAEKERKIAKEQADTEKALKDNSNFGAF